jgi:hypothetical protein
MEYLRLQPEESLPEWPFVRPFQAVVVIDETVSPEWQEKVSEWLVEAGCLYMMAWGINCSSWDDSVDMAAMKKFDFKEIPEKDFVMSTWHENEPIEEAFFYSKSSAIHPVEGVLEPIIIHISAVDKRKALFTRYENA